MTLARTEEQVAADDALTAAIERVRAAYEDDPDPMVLTDYIIVMVMQGWDDDGDGFTLTGTHVRDGEMPIYREVGLVHYAAARLNARINQRD